MNLKNKGGFLKTVILIIIALALLKLVWDFDILDILNKPAVKNVLEAILGLLQPLWDFIKNLFSVFNK